MDLDRVKVLVAHGLSIYCATCTKYWRGREQGLQGDACTAVRDCGSPLSKLAFPEYEGPIKDHTRWCFVCSAPAKYGVQVRGSERVFGMCSDHIGWLKSLAPSAREAAAAATDVKTENGTISAEALLRKPKSLWERIAETEAEFAAEDAKKG